MHFCLVDRVLERAADRIVTIKHVSAAEEYLQDHFPTFPVLPGVFMLEAMVQAARVLVEPAGAALPMVLGQVRALKYGRFVKPGATLRVEIALHKAGEDGSADCKGEVRVIEPGMPLGDEAPVAASGRFVMRPARVGLAVS